MAVIGPGTRVKCVVSAKWVAFDLAPSGRCSAKRRTTGPVADSVWTVAAATKIYGVHVLRLAEWREGPRWFDARAFRPLDGIDELAALVADVKAPASAPSPARVLEEV